MRHDTTAAPTLKTLRHIANAKASRERFHRALLREIQKAVDRRIFLASLEKQQRDAPHEKCALRARKNTARGL